MTNNAHATYSPSSIYRNLNCVGSIALIKKTNSKSKVSAYAKEGTLAHDYAKAALECIHGMKHFDFDQIPDEEMRHHVTQYCAWIGELNKNFRKTHAGVLHYIEHQVRWDENFWGTADYILTGYNKETHLFECVICDLKYGKGVEVSAEENAQILGYVLCLQKELNKDFSKAHCFIYQPRIPGKEFTRWTIDTKVIEGTGGVILQNKENCLSLLDPQNFKIDLIEQNTVAGEWCRFCAAKMKCKSYMDDLNSTQLKVLDEVQEIPEVSSLTLEQKLAVFQRRKRIKAFVDEICSDLMAIAASGTEKIPGYKLVEGVRRRKWKDNSGDVANALIQMGVENPYKTSLIGIGDVEKIVGKGKIGELTELSKPTYQLVPDTDKRTEIQVLGIDEIEEISFDE